MPARRAVIFVPHFDRRRWEDICYAAAAAHGEEVAAAVADRTAGGGWRDAEAMIQRGEADVILVARWDHVPPDALPHVRVVAEADDSLAPRQRRPRGIRRER